MPSILLVNKSSKYLDSNSTKAGEEEEETLWDSFEQSWISTKMPNQATKVLATGKAAILYILSSIVFIILMEADSVIKP
jgi:hypothetical protein